MHWLNYYQNRVTWRHMALFLTDWTLAKLWDDFVHNFEKDGRGIVLSLSFLGRATRGLDF